MTQHSRAAAALVALILLPWPADGASVPIDLTGLRPGPIAVARGDDSVTVTWADEAARTWRATFSLDPAKPLDYVDRGRHHRGRERRAAVLSRRNRKAARWLERLLRRSGEPS